MRLSGPDWCDEFPTSASLDDLASPFRENCKAFITALQTAGATIEISATYRPAERAYLMHWASMISRGKADPTTVPAMPGVDIGWLHPTPPETIGAAAQMCQKYKIAFPAALVPRHTQRLAIDMEITLPKGGRGDLILPHTVVFAEDHGSLYAAGASYGVIKLLTDPPHWSSDGH